MITGLQRFIVNIPKEKRHRFVMNQIVRSESLEEEVGSEKGIRVEFPIVQVLMRSTV